MFNLCSEIPLPSLLPDGYIDICVLGNKSYQKSYQGNIDPKQFKKLGIKDQLRLILINNCTFNAKDIVINQKIIKFYQKLKKSPRYQANEASDVIDKLIFHYEMEERLKEKNKSHKSVKI